MALHLQRSRQRRWLRLDGINVADCFNKYHPLVDFLFFTLVLVYSMVLMHPVCLAVSLAGAIWAAMWAATWVESFSNP